MRLPAWLAPLSLALLPACNGPGAAAMDALDPWRIVVGASTGAGVRVKGGGWFHTGLLMGVKPHASALGVKYGEVYAFQLDSPGYEADPAYIYRVNSTFNGGFGTGSYKLIRKEYAVLPMLASFADSAPQGDIAWNVPEEGNELDGLRYIWSPEALRNERFAAIHAFDVETEIAILLYIDVGFSPGELVDFFVGALTGIDIAKDDGRAR